MKTDLIPLFPPEGPMLALALLVAIGLPAVSHADGIPYDRKNNRITTEHTLFSMTPDQVEEAEALRTITLTKKQWATMREKVPGYPKRLTLISHRHNDCTCGITGYYAIWLPENQFGVFDGVPTRIDALVRNRMYHEGALSVTMDARGQFYFNGQLVPYPSLKKQIPAGIEAWKEKGEEVHHLSVAISIPAGMTEKSVTLATRIREIRALFDEVGGSSWVL